jgi:hypothetical protein
MRFFGRKRVTQQRRPAEAYDDLRKQVLRLTPDQLGRAFADEPVLALLMETGYSEAVATLAGVVDGTSSLYFSNGRFHRRIRAPFERESGKTHSLEGGPDRPSAVHNVCRRVS